MMNEKGIPVSRWIDGVLEDKENMDQPDNVRAMVFWGHAPNSQTRLPDMQKAMAKLDLLVVVDPYPDHVCCHARAARTVFICFRPVTTQFETLWLCYRFEPLAAVARKGHVDPVI